MNQRAIEIAAQKADDDIMALCAPGKMSKPQAVDFLERVIIRCEAAIEALKYEMEEDE